MVELSRKAVLDGYRIVDLTWVWAGPTATSYLADLGAEVIKIESRDRLDYNRLRALFHKYGNVRITKDRMELLETVSMFENLNRSKLSLTVNFRTREGVKLLRRLVKESDIVIENFRPGVLKKVGLDYDSLKLVKPDIIMLSLSGGGQDGPLESLAAYGPTITSLVGLEALVGYPGEEPIGMLSIGYSDPSSGVHAVAAVLAAVYHHQRTGEGQYVDVSELDSMAVLLGEAVMDYEMNGRVMKPVGNEHPYFAPHGIYPTSQKDRWVAIAVGSEREWVGLCQALRVDRWTGRLDFRGQNRRWANRRKLDEMLARRTSKDTQSRIVDVLQSHGVAAAPVLNPEEIFDHPYFVERGLQVELTHPIKGPSKVVSIPWKMTASEPRVRSNAPLLGQHNSYVLKQVLGLSDAEIKRLTKSKVLF